MCLFDSVKFTSIHTNIYKFESNSIHLSVILSQLNCETNLNIHLDWFQYRDALNLGKGHRLCFVAMIDIYAGGAAGES